jgi:hypothetical protein
MFRSGSATGTVNTGLHWAAITVWGVPPGLFPCAPIRKKFRKVGRPAIVVRSMPSESRFLMPLMERVSAGSAAVEAFLGRWGFWVLALLALGYYGSYYDTGLTLTGERGSNVLIAARILGGEKPFVDFFPGYNVLWFYPMTAIYAVIGPHWLVTRVYFLVLAAVTSLMGYALVRRVTGQAWLAFLAGTFMLLMPGAIFRNYMGFIGVLAASTLVRAYVLDAGSSKRQLLWMGVAGAALSVCFLIRIEPSLLLAIVWFGLVLLYPFGIRGEFFLRLRTVVLGTLFCIAAFVAVHAPFVAYSYQRGFGPEFTGQYSRYIGLLRWEMEREWSHWLGPRDRKNSGPADALDATVGPGSNKTERGVDEENSTESSGRDGRRSRAALGEIFTEGGLYFFAAALWMPVFVAPCLVISGTLLLSVSLVTWSAVGKMRALVALTTTGCALSLFPQYFFFRPDSVHLNEFLIAFWPASLCSMWVLMQSARSSGFFAAKLWSGFLAALVALLFIVSFNALFGRNGSGSIMASRGDDALFQAFNGVRAKVKSKDIADWEGLRDAVLAHSRTGEFVVTYPYVPIVNVMCDRPTYQWSLYVDNATASSSFLEKEARTLRERKPAVIVINDRAINKTEQSRFSNWASRLCEQIKQDYELAGTFFGNVEVYGLRQAAGATKRPPDAHP